MVNESHSLVSIKYLQDAQCNSSYLFYLLNQTSLGDVAPMGIKKESSVFIKQKHISLQQK